MIDKALNFEGCRLLVIKMKTQAFRDVSTGSRAAKERTALEGELFRAQRYASYFIKSMLDGKRPRPIERWLRTKKQYLDRLIATGDEAEGWLYSGHCAHLSDLANLEGQVNVSAAIARVKNSRVAFSRIRESAKDGKR